MKLQLLDAIGEITEARTAAGLWSGVFADWSQRSRKNSIFGSSGPAFAGTVLFSVSA